MSDTLGLKITDDLISYQQRCKELEDLLSALKQENERLREKLKLCRSPSNAIKEIYREDKIDH